MLTLQNIKGGGLVGGLPMGGGAAGVLQGVGGKVWLSVPEVVAWLRKSKLLDVHTSELVLLSPPPSPSLSLSLSLLRARMRALSLYVPYKLLKASCSMCSSGSWSSSPPHTHSLSRSLALSLSLSLARSLPRACARAFSPSISLSLCLSRTLSHTNKQSIQVLHNILQRVWQMEHAANASRDSATPLPTPCTRSLLTLY
jgi:hypothetical protein